MVNWHPWKDLRSLGTIWHPNSKVQVGKNIPVPSILYTSETKQSSKFGRRKIQHDVRATTATKYSTAITTILLHPIDKFILLENLEKTGIPCQNLASCFFSTPVKVQNHLTLHIPQLIFPVFWDFPWTSKHQSHMRRYDWTPKNQPKRSDFSRYDWKTRGPNGDPSYPLFVGVWTHKHLLLKWTVVWKA